MLTLDPERHPDNVAAALYGGFVGTYLNELKPKDLAWKEIPLSEVLPSPAGGIDTGVMPPKPPVGIGHYKRFPWSKKIKAITIIPDFELATAKARSCLPETYTRADVVSFVHNHNQNHTFAIPPLMYHIDLQPPTRDPSPLGPQPGPPGPRHDLSCNARQDSSTLPQAPDPWPERNPKLHEPFNPARSFGHLSLRRWSNNSSACDRSF